MSITTILAIKSTVKYTLVVPGYPLGTGIVQIPTIQPCQLVIVFGDKSHTNLYRTLALKPIIFPLTLFNRTSRNSTRFWRPIGYIPNLSCGKGGADRRKTSDKLQNEHTCLSCIFESLRKITREGGFDLVVLVQNVHVKVWIHYFLGDTEGNNI
jgi:hypothetical protein